MNLENHMVLMGIDTDPRLLIVSSTMAMISSTHQISGKQAAILATTLGVTILYYVDPPRFKKYIRRPAQLLVSGVVTVVGFLGNVAHDIAAGQQDEWRSMIQEVDDYLERTGLYEEWGADVPDHLPRNIMVLNEIQHSWSMKDRSNVKLLRKTTTTTLPSLSLAERYMKFATAVYGAEAIAAAQLTVDDMKGSFDELADWTLEREIAQHVGVEPKDILVADVEVGDSTEYLRHMIVVDHAERSVVLAVRGTISITSALVDLAAFTDEFCGGHAHAGMAKMAKAVWKRASEAVAEKIQRVPADYDLVITGHSLGAGVACLIAIMLHHEKESNPSSIADMPQNIRCMAYAPPPVFYPLTAAKTAVANTTAYVHNMDCVPSLSIHGVRRLIKTINDLDVPLKNIPHFDILPGDRAPAVCVEAVETSILQPLSEKDRAPPLCVPAHSLVWLREETPEEEYSTMVLDPILYSTRVIDVHSRMVSDHMQPNYEQALRLLVQAEEDTI